MATDDTAISPEHFDRWYAAMPTSPRRDELVQRHLGLPAAVLSSSLLPWAGIAEVVDRLCPRAPATLVDLGCGRGDYGPEVADRTHASLSGIDFHRRRRRRSSTQTAAREAVRRWCQASASSA